MPLPDPSLPLLGEWYRSVDVGFSHLQALCREIPNTFSLLDDSLEEILIADTLLAEHLRHEATYIHLLCWNLLSG